MYKNFKTFALATTLIITAIACNKDPKVIPLTTENESSKPSGVFSDETTNDVNTNQKAAFSDDLHTVVVNEVLPTSKYTYLNVNEGEKQFWIATRTKDVSVGKTYFYKGGLLKTNFESKEYNRVFETVYLISSLVATNHASTTRDTNTNINSNSEIDQSKVIKEDIPTHTEKIIEHKGSIKIAELVKDPKKYEGKTVQISGVCTKINPGIMERNWILLKDGSKDDFDLVVTSDVFVPEGSAITVKAIVTLNKDFGAGYKYDLILENGTLIK